MATPPVTLSTGHNARSGMLLALAGFALLSCGDGIIKSIAGEWPGGAVATLRYVFGTILLTALVRVREGPAGLITHRPWLHLGRGASVAIGGSCFFAAIFLMPLSEATAIQFTSPMFVAVGSALFMREHASKAVWACTLLAFTGVLIVLRPNVSELGWAALLPMVTALTMATMMILNRKAMGEGGALKMQYLISIFALPVLFALTWLTSRGAGGHFTLPMPSTALVAKCAIVSVTASCAHGLLYMATERASAAVIAPMTYVQMIVSILIGYFVYGDMPDLTAMGGAALIIASGLGLWRLQR